MRPRVLLADDHKIVLEGLRKLLESEFELLETVEDGRALVASAIEHSPDVIVADISMPLLNGIEAVKQVKKAGVTAKFLFLTMHADVTYAIRAFEAGASGYVLKHSAPAELITAIREVLQGRTYVTPKIAGEVIQAYRKGDHRKKSTVAQLTHRQREVLQLLAEGHSAKQSASVLGISPRTVEFHKYRIMNVLGLRTTPELTQFAIKHGILSP